jgi:hypothetical protein
MDLSGSASRRRLSADQEGQAFQESVFAEACVETRDCLVQFPRSTLPTRLRGVFLLSMQYSLLRDLGETAPFRTRLFLRTHSGLQIIEPSIWYWNDDISTVCLTATGPHASDISSRLAGLVKEVLATTTFDQDGFVETH